MAVPVGDWLGADRVDANARSSAVPLLVAFVGLLAGCFGGAPAGSEEDAAATLPALPSDLAMDRFELVSRNDTAATWEWEGAVPAYAGGATPAPSLTSTFQLPAALPLTVTVLFEKSAAGVLGAIVDGQDNARCFGSSVSSDAELCHLALPFPLAANETWRFTAWPDAIPDTETRFHVTLGLNIEPRHVPRPVAFGNDGPRAVPSGFADARFVVHPSGLPVSEPTVGVTSMGNLFVPAPLPRTGPSGESRAPLTTLRSADGGRTWQPTIASTSVGADLDPWAWVDPATDRVFRVGLTGTCSEVAFSDDEGRTWDSRPLRGCGIPGGHYEKLTTGPPPAGVDTSGYPNVVYYSSSVLADYLTDGAVVGHTGGVLVSASLDGGTTWQPGGLAHPARRSCYGWGGPVVVAPDGTAFSPAQFCDGVRIALSTDGAATWHEDAVLDARGMMGGFLGPSMAVDAEGRAYAVYSDRNGRAVLHVRDPATGDWSDAIDVTPPGVNATTFTLVDVGLPGRVAIAFHGTPSDPASWPRVNPIDAPDDAAWHLHVVISANALGADPTFVDFQLTPAHDPIQRGCIDLQGSQTASCRNLADFIDMTVRDGRPFVVFADGCVSCDDAASSRDSVLGLATFFEGEGLGGARLGPFLGATT